MVLQRGEPLRERGGALSRLEVCRASRTLIHVRVEHPAVQQPAVGWLAFRKSDDASVHQTGPALAQLIFSFILLGGAVGKWTDAYWSGDVLRHLLFEYQPDPTFAWVRRTFDPATIAVIAKWYSRAAVLGETVMGLLFLLRPSLSLPISLALLFGMWLASPGGIIDAIGPLFGLLIAGISLLPRRDAPVPHPADESVDGVTVAGAAARGPM